jgi:hypothetical protein
MDEKPSVRKRPREENKEEMNRKRTKPDSQPPGSDASGSMNPAPPPISLSDFQKPEDILGLIKHERVRWLVYTIALGGAKIPGDPRPDWAARAASEFWRCCQDFPRTKGAQSENYQSGFMLGLIRRVPMPGSLEAEPALSAVASPEQLTNLAHAEIAKASADDAADFYAGLSDGLKRGKLSPRSPYLIYLVFAVAWPELSELKNVTQLYAWFETNLGSNMAGTRDRIAKICQKVRMPLTDKGGRPKQKPRNAPKS